MKPKLIAFSFVASLLGMAASARAQTGTENEATKPSSWPSTVRQSNANGSFLPLSLTPSVATTSSAQAAGFGGYDSAKAAPVMQSFAEARVMGPVALRVGAALRDGEDELAPSIGVRAQLLSQERHGVVGAVALFYKAEGFTEGEGELETVLSFGTRVGRTLLIGNLAYGQDPEGNERDGELRAAALVQLPPGLQLGFDARGRFDLGSEPSKLRASNEPTYDVDAGPVASLALGPVALAAHVGVSVIRRLDQQAEGGVVALAGLGTAF
jgi:hypothetical protein